MHSPVRILVVDDHPNTANMLARAISRLGSHVDVVAATSGLEALHHVEDDAVDILITDMMMPEMTGMELIEKLNDDPSISPAATFLLTAHDSAGIREITQRLNVKEVISKPAHPEQICELISKTISELNQSKSVNLEPATREQTAVNPDNDATRVILNISQLLWDVAKKFQPQADIKDHLLVVGKTEPNSVIRGNVVQLRQALRSLVWSAINNTPRGGSVILSSESGSNMVKIFVRDTGYGNNGHENAEANDRDLEIVKSIARQHGGDVIIESEIGKGTCFTLSLPLYQIKESTQVNYERKTQ